MKICHNCQNEYQGKPKFCPACGCSLEKPKWSKKKKSIVGFISAVIVVGSVGLVGGIIVPQVRRSNNYKAATEYFLQGNYDMAREEFLLLGDYKDSKELSVKCVETAFREYLSNKDFSNARKFLQSKKNEIDITSYENECDYKEAENAEKNGKYRDAYKLYRELAKKEYEDAVERKKALESYIAEEELYKILAGKELYYSETDYDDYDEEGYRRYDFDEDGIDELIVWKNRRDLTIYHFQNMQYKEMYADGYSDCVSYSSKDKIMLVEQGGCLSWTSLIYRLEEGKFTLLDEGSTYYDNDTCYFHSAKKEKEVKWEKIQKEYNFDRKNFKVFKSGGLTGE